MAIGDLFGWLSPGTTGRGIVLCGTHGYEQHCAHRPWRGLAQAIAATGCSVLRFDYPGVGDSGDQGAGQLESWIGAIESAIAFLRDTMGLAEITLVGFRLGGTLAALAAEASPVDRLVLLDPFVTGRAFLREMTLQARVIDVLPDGRSLPADLNRVSVGGFTLPGPVVAALGAIALTKAGRAPAQDILLMGAERGGLAAHYRGLGAQVTTAPFPDLAQLCASALTAVMSEVTRDTVAAFAAEGAPAGRAVRREPRQAAPIGGPGWREAAIHLASGAFAIQCRPDRAEPPAASILFLNMGADVHTGHARQAVDFSRRLAGLGMQSLRIDLRGVGDSPDRPDGAMPMYNLAALDDVRAAVDRLGASSAGPVVVTGVCSGAYLAFQAICHEPRITGAVLANPYCFDWALTHGDQPFSAAPIRTLAAYSSLFRQGAAWRRLLSGETPVFTIAAGLIRRVAEAGTGRLKTLWRCGATQDAVPERVARIRARGGRLALVYSAGDLGLVDLHARFGRDPAEIDRVIGTPVRILDGADHAFGDEAARQVLFETLQSMVASLHEASAVPAGAPAFRADEAAPSAA